MNERIDYSRVAVIIPCHDEEATIGGVVGAFRRELPGCTVVVADNCSSDETARVARDSGAMVIAESRKGKGFAVRRLLADVDAECYIMVDGDATYDPSVAPQLVELVTQSGLDMVNVERVKAPGQGDAYRRGHELGNRGLTWIFQTLFRLPLKDTLSGYRAMSRRFVKSFPTGATGFEIEAELNAHAAVLGVPMGEIPGRYFERPTGSASKLNTYRDGLRITRRNLRLFRDAMPNRAFFILSLPWFLMALILVGVPVYEYLTTGIVSRFPSLIAGTGTMTVGVLLIVAGFVMDRVARNRVEAVRLSYLALPGPIGLILKSTGPLDGGRLRESASSTSVDHAP